MKTEYDPKDLIAHIGEAMGLMLTAIAQEHDAPEQLLDAMHRAERKCIDHPTMYSPETRAMVRYAGKALDGAILGAKSRKLPQ